MAMRNTTGIYFDGKSSRPQEVKIIFNPQTQILYIQNGFYYRFEWKLTDIEASQNGEMLSIIRKDHPEESISIQDTEFAQHFYQFKNIGWYQKLLNQSKAFYLGLTAFFVGFLLISYFFIIPYIGEKSIEIIPESYDQKLGDTVFQESIYAEKIDENKTKIVNDFAKELKFSHDKPLNFTIIESDEVNAFALPNGEIVIFTGIIKKMNSYEELVALIGHEATHIHHRHSMKMLGRNLAGYIFISTILGDANGIMTAIGENAHALTSLSYSRHYEENADNGAFNTLKINKINPKGMLDLFQTLENENKNSIIPEFISTHPITQNRIANTHNLIKENPYSYNENPTLKKLFLEIKK